VSSFAILWDAPAIEELPAEHHRQPVVVLMAMHAGDPPDGRQALASLRDFGTPIADLSDVMPYLEVQQLLDEDYPATTGSRCTSPASRTRPSTSRSS
jgi:hypothetical protein